MVGTDDLIDDVLVIVVSVHVPRQSRDGCVGGCVDGGWCCYCY
jgi:hypothetical protein